MIHAERLHRMARQSFRAGKGLVLRRGPPLGRSQVDLIDACARRAHGDLEAVMHHCRLVARIHKLGDVLRQSEDLELARRQPASGNELDKRVPPGAVGLAPPQMQRGCAAFTRQAFAHLRILLDIVLVQILDHVRDMIAWQFFATANQSLGKLQRAVVRVVAEDAGVGIAHQPVAYLDGRHQLAEHAPLAGHVREGDHALGQTAARAGSQPAFATRRREAVDRRLAAIRSVLDRTGLEHVRQALSDKGFGADPGELEEKLVGLGDGVVLAQPHGPDAERAKLLQHEHDVRCGLVQQIRSPAVNRRRGITSLLRVNLAFPTRPVSRKKPDYQGVSDLELGLAHPQPIIR